MAAAKTPLRCLWFFLIAFHRRANSYLPCSACEIGLLGVCQVEQQWILLERRKEE